MNTEIHVISLRSAQRRREEFSALAPTQGWSFFDARTELDERLVYSPRTAALQGGRVLTPGEIGCYSSHYALWCRLAEETAVDRYIVLEDDILADWDFLNRICHEAAPPFLKLCYLLSCPTRKVVGPFLDTYEIIELLGYGYGTQGYLINKDVAKIFVRALRTVIEPVDLAMAAAWRHDVPNLSVFPLPLIHRIGPSSIADNRWASSKKTVPEKAFRVAVRTREALRRTAWRWLRRKPSFSFAARS